MATAHTVTVDGDDYTFEVEPNRSPAGTLTVYAPGVVPFTADCIDNARDVLRSTYAAENLDQVAVDAAAPATR